MLIITKIYYFFNFFCKITGCCTSATLHFVNVNKNIKITAPAPTGTDNIDYLATHGCIYNQPSQVDYTMHPEF